MFFPPDLQTIPPHHRGITENTAIIAGVVAALVLLVTLTLLAVYYINTHPTVAPPFYLMQVRKEKKIDHAHNICKFLVPNFIYSILLFSDAQIITGPPWSFATKAVTPATPKSSSGFTRRKVLSRLSTAVKRSPLVMKRCHLEDCKDPEKKRKKKRKRIKMNIQADQTQDVLTPTFVAGQCLLYLLSLPAFSVSFAVCHQMGVSLSGGFWRSWDKLGTSNRPKPMKINARNRSGNDSNKPSYCKLMCGSS